MDVDVVVVVISIDWPAAAVHLGIMNRASGGEVITVIEGVHFYSDEMRCDAMRDDKDKRGTEEEIDCGGKWSTTESAEWCLDAIELEDGENEVVVDGGGSRVVWPRIEKCIETGRQWLGFCRESLWWLWIEIDWSSSELVAGVCLCTSDRPSGRVRI